MTDFNPPPARTTSVIAMPFANSSGDIGLGVAILENGEPVVVGVGIEWQDVSTVRGRMGRPTVRLSRAEAQRLFDGLWRCGLRPSEMAHKHPYPYPMPDAPEPPADD